MAKFYYRAINDSGEEKTGFIEAETKIEAQKKLQNEELHIFELNEENKPTGNKEVPSQSKSTFAFTNNSNQIIFFTDQLANLLEAGIQLGESLQITSKLINSDDFKTVVNEIYNSIKGGQSFAESLQNHPNYFNKSYIGMIKAGEEGGFLDLTCRRLADNLKNKKQLKSFIITSLIYPMILLVVTVLAVIVMMTYVLPKFASIYSNYGGDLPYITRILLDTSEFISSYGFYLIFIIFALIAGGIAYYKTPPGKKRFDSLILKFPLLGQLVSTLTISRLARSLGTMLESGVPLLKSIEFSKNIISNVMIEEVLEEATAKVKKGGNFSEALQKSDFFPDAAIYMIGIGERTGKLSEMMMQVADNFEQNYKERLEKILKIFEPLTILVMGVAIGIIVVAMLLPILNMNTLSL